MIRFLSMSHCFGPLRADIIVWACARAMRSPHQGDRGEKMAPQSPNPIKNNSQWLASRTPILMLHHVPITLPWGQCLTTQAWRDIHFHATAFFFCPISWCVNIFCFLSAEIVQKPAFKKKVWTYLTGHIRNTHGSPFAVLFPCLLCLQSPEFRQFVFTSPIGL